jgi:hypothetical protein
MQYSAICFRWKYVDTVEGYDVPISRWQFKVNEIVFLELTIQQYVFEDL